MQQVAVLDGEGDLVAAARRGDQAAFTHLVQPYLALGYRLAATMLNDPGQAEDAVQDATLRAWNSIGRLRSESQFRSWFLTIVANRCRSARRARWWSVIRSAEIGWRLPSPAETADARHDLAQALERLRPEDRGAVFLRFYEDMSSREVAEALGISSTAARSRIHRALQRLRVELGEEEL